MLIGLLVDRFILWVHQRRRATGPSRHGRRHRLRRAPSRHHFYRLINHVVVSVLDLLQTLFSPF